MDEEEKDKIWNKIRMVGDRPMYLGRKGEPLSLQQWASYNADMDYRRVAYDEIAATTVNPASYLSTVWLGIDHNFMLSGPPVIFETMRFDLTQKPLSMLRGTYHPSLEFPDPEEPERTIDQERYSTEEQASLGHRRILWLIHEKEMQ